MNPLQFFTSSWRKSSNFKAVGIEEILRPVWKLTYYIGLLPEWCRPLPKKRRIVFILQCFGIATSCFSLLFMCVFQFTQLIRAVIETTPVTELVGNLLWCSPYPINITAIVCYLFHRKKMLSFFKEWANFEKVLGNNVIELNNISTRKWGKLMYVCYVLMCLSLLCFLFRMAMIQPEKSYHIATYLFFRETFGFVALAIFQVFFTVSLGWIFQFLSDVVPGLVFHHSAMALKALEDEFRHVFLTYTLSNVTQNANRNIYGTKERFNSLFCRKFRIICAQYEMLSKLTKQANSVFSLVIVADHLVKLFMICSLLFGLINVIRNPTADLGVYIFGATVFLFRLITCALMCAKVDTVGQEFKESMSINLNCYCHLLSKEECELVTLFISRLEQDKLAARPLNLYDITPSTLLTLASAIITYVIVLVQSK